MVETLEHLSAMVDTVQGSRYASNDVKTQIARLQEDSRSPTDRTGTLQRADTREITPAAQALLFHLNLTVHPNSKLEDSDLIRNIDKLTLNLGRRSSNHIAQLLQTSRQSAIKRFAAVEDILDALATDDAYSRRINALENGIAAAKAEVEEATKR